MEKKMIAAGTFASLVLAGAVLYIGAVSYMYLNQKSLLFKPEGELPEPAAIGLADVDVISLPMSDGTVLTAWSAPPAIDGAPTVLPGKPICNPRHSELAPLLLVPVLIGIY